MPCRVDMPPVPKVTKAEYDKLRKVADKLTLENDQLREIILRLDDGGKLTAAEKKKVNTEQVKHRKEDLKRLEKTFKQLRDAEKLGRVMLADPKKPLEPQLGFDPDEF